ncbi:MAG: DUF4168 domain-containing protein [Ectothiorhodospiraceae bacterium]|nr:DUF4168 domain-containing protein [Ectothiorhodospiraceae bacterium]MCH8504784.1 DUF4168 domain-containing protein [Ectothiorhodospiraceae bacterium]
MRTYKKASVFMIPLLSGLLFSSLAVAQAQQDQGGQGQQGGAMMEQEAQDFDREELEKFADAYVKVGEIHTEYSQRLQEVESTDEAQNLQQEANDEMVQAIQDAGLEVQDYSAIAAALERDPEMREDVVGMIEERQ